MPFASGVGMCSYVLAPALKYYFIPAGSCTCGAFLPHYSDSGVWFDSFRMYLDSLCLLQDDGDFQKIKSKTDKKKDKLLTMDPTEITYEMVNKKLREIALARGKKGVDRQEQVIPPQLQITSPSCHGHRFPFPLSAYSSCNSLYLECIICLRTAMVNPQNL